MAAHLYWRVKFTNSNGGVGWFVKIDKLVFQDLAEADITTGGSAIASSSQVGYEASQAFDKTLSNNGWACNNGGLPAWLGYLFPTPVDVLSAKMQMIELNEPVMPIDKYVFLEYSDNGTTWFPAGEQTWRVAGLYNFNTSVTIKAGTPSSSKITGNLSRVFGNPPDQRSIGATSVKTALYKFDAVFGGNGTISGTLTIENIPGVRKVRLFRRHDAAFIRETWSNSVGQYSFSNIHPNFEYFVVAHDHLRVHNGVISDMLTP